MSVIYKQLVFERKSLTELQRLTLDRLKKYHRSQENKVARAFPWCCEYQCCPVWPDDNGEYKKQWKAWNAYVKFVCAVYRDRKANEITG